MLHMDFIAEIRRRHLVSKESISWTARKPLGFPTLGVGSMSAPKVDEAFLMPR